MDIVLWETRAFLFGVLTGTICVGGLVIGMKLVISAPNLEDRRKATRHKLFGGLLLGGQFLAAIAVLTYYMKSTAQPDPVPLALGLIGSIGAANFILAALRK